jgi:hypothetical protein
VFNKTVIIIIIIIVIIVVVVETEWTGTEARGPRPPQLLSLRCPRHPGRDMPPQLVACRPLDLASHDDGRRLL